MSDNLKRNEETPTEHRARLVRTGLRPLDPDQERVLFPFAAADELISWDDYAESERAWHIRANRIAATGGGRGNYRVDLSTAPLPDRSRALSGSYSPLKRLRALLASVLKRKRKR